MTEHPTVLDEEIIDVQTSDYNGSRLADLPR